MSDGPTPDGKDSIQAIDDNHRGFLFMIGGVVTVLGVVIAGVVAHINENVRDRISETCGALSTGSPLPEDYEFPAENSFQAVRASCAYSHPILISSFQFRESILEAINRGVDVPRPLVEDARSYGSGNGGSRTR